MTTKALTAAFVEKMNPPSAGRVEFWDRYLPGFGLRVTERGIKSWVAMTRVHGRQVRLTLGRYPALKVDEARELARDRMRQATGGVDPRQTEAREKREADRQRRNTFAAVAADFMKDKAKLRTREEYQRKLDVDLLPEWGATPIKSITRADVRRLLREKARKAPIAANRLQALISAIFNWALDEEIVDASPVARMKPVGEEAERERVLADGEVKLIWRSAEQMAYPFGRIYQLLLVTAQRRGEVAGIQWPEVQGDLWMLPAKRAKRGKGHAVPLSPLAKRILDGLPRLGAHAFSSGRSRRKRGDGTESTAAKDHIVSGWSKAKVRCDELILAAMRKAAVERGDDPEKVKPLADWTVHDFRRTAATNMRGLGVDRIVVSKVLNHEEAGVTKIYDRFAADPEKRAALDAWAERLEIIIGLKKPPKAKVIEMPRRKRA